MELQISMNIKDITIPLIIRTMQRHSEHYTNLSFVNHNVPVSSVSAPRRCGAMQCVYALNPVCIVLIIPGHSRRSSPSGLWT